MRAGAPPAAFAAEYQLLLCCARAAPDAATVEKLRNLAAAPGLNWNQVEELATRHRLAPLLFRHLDTHAPDLVPTSVAARLRSAFLENTHLALQALRESLLLAAALVAKGIPMLQLKGTTMSAMLYGEPNLRVVGDVDVIVPKSEVWRALRAAAELGYQECFGLTPAQLDRLLRDGHHVTMGRSDGMYVEIHWRIAKRAFSYPVDMEAVWRRSQIVSSGGHTWRSLAREDLLPVLAIQGSKESWATVERLASVAELARAMRWEEWTSALASAEAWKAGRTLRVGLLAAAPLVDAEYPPVVQRWLDADPRAAGLAAAIERRLFGARPARELLGYQVAVREGLADKLRFLAAGAFTTGPEDWTSIPLPWGTRWLYPLLRPFRLLGRRRG